MCCTECFRLLSFGFRLVPLAISGCCPVCCLLQLAVQLFVNFDNPQSTFHCSSHTSYPRADCFILPVYFILCSTFSNCLLLLVLLLFETVVAVATAAAVVVVVACCTHTYHTQTLTHRCCSLSLLIACIASYMP